MALVIRRPSSSCITVSTALSATVTRTLTSPCLWMASGMVNFSAT